MEPEIALASDLSKLQSEWVKLGIAPDDFVTCSKCGGIIAGFELSGDRVCKC